MYEELCLRKAIVINIDDPDKKGKIQVRVLPDLKNVEDNLLPWAIPYSSLNSTSIMSNDLPEVNSIVRVFVREDYQRVYYMLNQYFYSLFDFNKVDSALSKISTISDKQYKNIVFRLYIDGGLEFHNNSTGEHGFIHKSGNSIYMDKDGKILLKGQEINLNGNSKQFVTWTELNTALSQFVTLLNTALTTTPIIGNGSPQSTWTGLPTNIDISAAKTTTIKTGG